MAVNKIWKIVLSLALFVTVFGVGASAVDIEVDDAAQNAVRTAAVRTQSTKVNDDKTLNILAIGNSFTQDTMRFVDEIAESAGYELNIGVLWRGSKTLSDHLNYIQTDEAAYRYTIYKWDEDGESVEENTSDSLAPASQVLNSVSWDLVFLQQASYDNGNPTSFYDEQGNSYLTQLTSLIRQKVDNPELSFAWLMGWAYAQDYTSTKFQQLYNSDQLTMYNAISDTLQNVIWSSGEFELIIPVGTAVQNVRMSYIGDNMNRDGLHLNYSIGRYTAGLTVAASIGIKLKDVTFVPDDSVRISEQHIPMLRQAVNAAVKSPFAVTQSTYTDTSWLPTAVISKIADSTGGVSVQWKEVSGARSYYVYRKQSGGEWTLLASTSSERALHNYVDSTVEHGVKYYYKIYTRFDSYLPIVQSAGKSMIHTVPTEFIEVTSSSKKKFKATWNVQEGTTSYQIRYADNLQMKKAKTVSVNAPKAKLTVSGMKSKTTYSVQIRSCIKVGSKTYRSEWSNLWLVTTK